MACVLGTWCDARAEDPPPQTYNSVFWSLRGAEGNTRDPRVYSGLCLYDFHFATLPWADVVEYALDVWLRDFDYSPGAAYVDTVDGGTYHTWGQGAQFGIPGLPVVILGWAKLDYDETQTRPCVLVSFCAEMYGNRVFNGKHWRFWPAESAVNAFVGEWTAADGSTVRLRPGKGEQCVYASGKFLRLDSDSLTFSGGAYWQPPSFLSAQANVNLKQGRYRFSYRFPDPISREMFEPSGSLEEGDELDRLGWGQMSMTEWMQVFIDHGYPLTLDRFDCGVWMWEPYAASASSLEPGGYSDPYVVDPQVTLNRTWQVPYFSSRAMTGRVVFGGGEHGIPELSWDWSSAFDGSGNNSIDGAVASGRSLVRGLLLAGLTFTFFCMCWRVLRQY